MRPEPTVIESVHWLLELNGTATSPMIFHRPLFERFLRDDTVYDLVLLAPEVRTDLGNGRLSIA